jgi:hypothetical protein
MPIGLDSVYHEDDDVGDRPALEVQPRTIHHLASAPTDADSPCDTPTMLTTSAPRAPAATTATDLPSRLRVLCSDAARQMTPDVWAAEWKAVADYLAPSLMARFREDPAAALRLDATNGGNLQNTPSGVWSSSIRAPYARVPFAHGEYVLFLRAGRVPRLGIIDGSTLRLSSSVTLNFTGSTEVGGSYRIVPLGVVHPAASAVPAGPVGVGYLTPDGVLAVPIPRNVPTSVSADVGASASHAVSTVMLPDTVSRFRGRGLPLAELGFASVRSVFDADDEAPNRLTPTTEVLADITHWMRAVFLNAYKVPLTHPRMLALAHYAHHLAPADVRAALAALPPRRRPAPRRARTPTPA